MSNSVMTRFKMSGSAPNSSCYLRSGEWRAQVKQRQNGGCCCYNFQEKEGGRRVADLAADTDRGTVRRAVDAGALPINCSILPCCTWMTARRGIRKTHAPIPPRRAGAVRGPYTLSNKHCASVQWLKSARREDEHPSVLCVSLFLCQALHILFALLSTATTLLGKRQKIKIRSPTRNHIHACARTCTRTRIRTHTRP